MEASVIPNPLTWIDQDIKNDQRDIDFQHFQYDYMEPISVFEKIWNMTSSGLEFIQAILDDKSSMDVLLDASNSSIKGTMGNKPPMNTNGSFPFLPLRLLKGV